jgi:hypothetical protein
MRTQRLESFVDRDNGTGAIHMDVIRRGTLIISQGIPLPAGGNIRTQACFQGWRAITNIDASGLDKRMSDMGWTCFHRAAPKAVNVLGFGNTQTIEKALRKIIQHYEATKFNCLEVTQLVQGSFVGISYVHMTAEARNIQQRP